MKKRAQPLKRTGTLPRGAPLKRTGFANRGASTLKRTVKKTKPPRYTGPTKRMRDAVLLRDNHTCQRCARRIGSGPYSLQHILPRGRGGKNTMRNLVTVCGSATSPGGCHDEIEHQQRAQATLEGWFVPNGIDPEVWPVLRFRRDWQMPGEPTAESSGWEPAEPHPLQVRGAA